MLSAVFIANTQAPWPAVSALTLDETAAALNVSAMTVLRMIRRCVIDGRQLCKGAP